MTMTTEASAIRVGDEIRTDQFSREFVQVIERLSFRQGTRIYIRLANGEESTLVACETVVINRMEN